MLRRKFLARVGVLMCAFVIGAVAAVWALQAVLQDVDQANADAAFLIDGIQDVGTLVNKIEARRFSPASQPTPADDALPRELNDAVARLAQHPVTRDGQPAAHAYRALQAAIEPFLAAWAGSAPARESGPDQRALETSLRVQQCVQDLGGAFRAHVAVEQAEVGRYFRTLVLVLTLAALVMVNVAAFVLLHTAQLVLRPVAALVEGSRELAAERFDHRVRIERDDEFGELARAYNHLAEQLEASEERKAESLRQLAVTLNHDLNNAMSIIELQLGLLDRQMDGNPTLTKHLREIRSTLSRMAHLVASLKNIRRVVLTDYGPGQKMVDLERSLAEDQGRPSTQPTHAKPA